MSTVSQSNVSQFPVSDDRAGRLTILRLGLGRDSIAMLCLLVERGLLVGGEVIGAEDVDAVVFTDTGNEWRMTYRVLPAIRAFCDRHMIRFIAQMKPENHVQDAWLRALEPLRAEAREAGQDCRETPPWRAELEGDTIETRAARGYYHARVAILADYASKDTIVAFSDPSCTSNHKIGPSRALIHDLSVERFGIGTNSGQWTAACKRGERLPHRVLLGIAADEAHRAGPVEGGPGYERCYYPLVEMGITKAMEGEILARHGFESVRKSGCTMCKFQPLSWYWALSVREPDTFQTIVEYEAAALARNKNLLIFPKGGLPLRDAVRDWRASNPDATVEAVLAKSYERCDRADGKIVRASGQVEAA